MPTTGTTFIDKVVGVLRNKIAWIYACVQMTMAPTLSEEWVGFARSFDKDLIDSVETGYVEKTLPEDVDKAGRDDFADLLDQVSKNRVKTTKKKVKNPDEIDSYLTEKAYYEPTSYLYDLTQKNPQVLAEYQGRGTKASETYNYGILGKSAAEKHGVYLFDAKGSVVETLNVTVTNPKEEGEANTYSTKVLNTLRYDAYGNITAGKPAQERIYAYAGEQFTAQTGLIYLRARNYDASTGTFTTRDSYLGDKYESATRNRYIYAVNNPVSFIDPSGHMHERGIGTSSQHTFQPKPKPAPAPAPRPSGTPSAVESRGDGDYTGGNYGNYHVVYINGAERYKSKVVKPVRNYKSADERKEDLKKVLLEKNDPSVTAFHPKIIDIRKQAFQEKRLRERDPKDIWYKSKNRYELAEEFIEILGAYSQNKDKETIIRDEFGGNQGWYRYKDELVNNAGCGIIATVNTYLYLSGRNNVSQEEFMELVDEMRKSSPLVDKEMKTLGGVFPLVMRSYLYNKLSAENIEMYSAWNISYSNQYEYMKRMLEDNKPVIWGLYSPYKDENIALYEILKDEGTLQRWGEANNHYVTVTGIYEMPQEDGSLQRMVEVSSWGNRLYIDYDEYEEFNMQSIFEFGNDVLSLNNGEPHHDMLLHLKNYVWQRVGSNILIIYDAPTE